MPSPFASPWVNTDFPTPRTPDSEITNPGFLSEALKIYLMMGGKEPMEKPRVLEWWRQDFEVLTFHATGTGGMTIESFIADGLISSVREMLAGRRLYACRACQA